MRPFPVNFANAISEGVYEAAARKEQIGREFIWQVIAFSHKAYL
jgi:hypothetical protein